MVTIFKRGRAALLFALTAILFSLFLFPPTASASNSRLYAVVNREGNLVRGMHVTATTHLGTGRYEVTFSHNVSKCAYTATVGEPHTGTIPDQILVFTAGGHLSQDGVYVETKNDGGGLTDYSFHLNVSCNKLYAVMNYDGSFNRGASVTSTTHLSTGQFEIDFNQDVSACAYTATIGDPANALVFSPGFVFTAGGHGSNGGSDPYGVYVETETPSGVLTDYPFHLNVICPTQYVLTAFAVVNSDGSFVRGASATSTTHLSTGSYVVTFNQDVSKCAYIATIGDTANGQISTQGLVFTATDSNPNSVDVETENYTGGPQGGLADYPFHLNVTC